MKERVRTMFLLHLLTLAASLMTSQGAPAGTRVVDLTHVLGNDSLFWVGQPPFNFTILNRGYHQGVDSWIEMNYIALAEHGGTHIDAPAHYVEGKWRTHDIPASNLIGPGVIIDITEKAKANPDYAITVGDLKEWEEKYGRIPDGAVVIMRSGWSQRYPDPKRMFNTETPEDATTYHFPGFHEDTARWIAEERNVVAVGTDAPSPDVGTTILFPVHKILNGKNIMLLEYVANVEQLPPSGSNIIIGVVKLRDGSGGHARLLGMLSTDGSGSEGLTSSAKWMLLLLIVTLIQHF